MRGPHVSEAESGEGFTRTCTAMRGHLPVTARLGVISAQCQRPTRQRQWTTVWFTMHEGVKYEAGPHDSDRNKAA